MSRHRARLLACLSLTAASAAACSTAQVQVVRPGSHDTVPATLIPGEMRVRNRSAFPADRCAKNREFGPITFLTNAGYTAAAGVIEVLAAKAKGYFGDVCLDVTIQPSFSTENYPLIAGNDAQFAAAGSFSEVVDFAGENNAKFRAIAVDGREPLDTLIVRQGGPADVAHLRDTAIGVQGAVTPAVAAMLAKAGLQHVDETGVVVKSYREVSSTDPDPVTRLADPEVTAITGTRSSDVLRLGQAAVPFRTMDPAGFRIPGSFGVTYTNATFATDYPTVVEDFIRATSKALAEALADPDGTVDLVARSLPGDAAFDLDAERARWRAEVAIIHHSPIEVPDGIPMRSLLAAELGTGSAIGLFGVPAPHVDDVLDIGPSLAVYDRDGHLIWPAKEKT